MNESCERREVVRLFSSPTLDTVEMVEKTIDKYSGEFKKTQLWEKLPRKVLWGTYLRILEYLQQINKIVISESGVIVYIWDKEGAERIMRTNLRYEKNKVIAKKG